MFKLFIGSSGIISSHSKFNPKHSTFLRVPLCQTLSISVVPLKLFNHIKYPAIFHDKAAVIDFTEVALVVVQHNK